MTGRVVVLGSLNADLVVEVSDLPRPGQTVLGSSLATFGGGKGANQALAAARLGAAVRMVGRVGDDDNGRMLIEGLRADGVDVAGVRRDGEAPTGVALIMVEASGENVIAVVPGANGRVEAADLDALAPGDLLVVQLEIPLPAVAAAAELAATAEARVLLNAAPARPLDDALLRHVDVLVVNEDEARLLGDGPPERAAQVLLGRGASAVVVTLGPRGALLAGPEGMTAIAGRPVDAVDTTAAGDAFVGGLAAALAAGAELAEAVGLGNAAGAAAATRRGAQASLPTRDDLRRLFGSGSMGP